MATTSWGMPLADESTIVNPIQTPLNAIANALNTALDTLFAAVRAKQGYFIGTDAERLALVAPDLRNGITWFASDTGLTWERLGGAWLPGTRRLAEFTPTITGMTGITTLAKYEQRGKLIHAEYEINRTASGRPTAAVTITLPTPPKTSTIFKNMGQGLFNLASGAQYPVYPRWTGGNTVVVNFPTVAGSAIGSGQNLSDTYPTNLAHGVGTTLHLALEYESA